MLGRAAAGRSPSMAHRRLPRRLPPAGLAGRDQADSQGMTAASGPPGLDLHRLTAYLDQARPGLVADPVTATMIAGGKSNLTYIVSGASGSVVLRRPPLG